jgi:cellulose synthase/poly-beta-1,6-N-acetylglucosamine synthase-like glycosyltransferase
MISVVLIGRDIRALVERGTASAFDAAQTLASSSEVIYVDSRSTDGTVGALRARFGEVLHIVELTGEMNAGIARNAGAAVARGDVLFFVDGDVEVAPEFLKAVMRDDGSLVHPVVAGQLPEVLYDRNWTPIGPVPDRHRIEKPTYSPNLGGVFAVERRVFEEVGGFAPEMRINEDLDLGLRLAARGYQVLHVPIPMGTHHTMEYFDWRRLWRRVCRGDLFYPGVTMRRHWGSAAYWCLATTLHRPTAVLLLTLALAVAFTPWFLLVYVTFIFAKNFRRARVSLLQDFAGTALSSLCALVGAALFFPRPPSAERRGYRVIP